MKNKKVFFIASLIAIAAVTSFLSSCSRGSSAVKPAAPAAPEFSSTVTNIISQSLIDTMRKKGMVIYSGETPPNVEGIYLLSPQTLLSPFGPEDTWEVGRVIDDYKYMFYDQVNSNLRISYKNVPYRTDTGSGLGCIITGKGNYFTIFFQFSGVGGGVPYTMAGLISGSISTSGVRNFQLGFMMTSKTGDVSNLILQPVNTGRVYNDGDGIADKTATFRIQQPVSGEGLQAGSFMMSR